MNRMTEFDATRLLVVTAMLLIIQGCLFSPDPKPPEPPISEYLPRTTIPGVMNNLRVSYEDQDLDRYQELFDQNDFVFVFDPVDVTNEGTPVDWDWSEEQNSTRNMFEADLVEGIDLDFVTGDSEDVIEGDERGRPFPEGTRKLIATEVLLRVNTRDPAGGENIIYEVTGDQAIFFLYQDTTEVQNGLPVWKIFEWRDKKIGVRPAPVSS